MAAACLVAPFVVTGTVVALSRRKMDAAAVAEAALRACPGGRVLRVLAAVLLGLLAAGSLLLLGFEPHRGAHAALPEELRPFRPLPIRLLNAANVAAARLGVELVPLDADGLVRGACERFLAERPAGAACDFVEAAGEYGEFREGLKVLVTSLREEAELTLIGRVFANHRIAMLLDQRLQLVHRWRSSSEERGDAAARSRVAGPIFVVGLPRTGTSFLHTLLAQDTDSVLSPLNWMVVTPDPPFFGSIHEGDQSAERPEPEASAAGGSAGAAMRRARRARITEASANLASFKAIAPGLDAQHAMTAFRPARDGLAVPAMPLPSAPGVVRVCVWAGAPSCWLRFAGSVVMRRGARRQLSPLLA